jgi:hypothetical protein
MLYTADLLEKCVRQNTWNYMDTQVLIDYGFISGNILEKDWSILFNIYKYVFLNNVVTSLELNDIFLQNRLDDFIHSTFQKHVNPPYFYIKFKNLGFRIGQTKY